MMNMLQACSVIAEHRPEDSLLVATMGAMFMFDRVEAAAGQSQPSSRLSSVPLMGGAAGLGLGLALAQPQRPVIVVDGDASLLMELGVLNNVAASQPRRFMHVVLHNGTQFTGLANISAPASGFRFAEAALNAGYRHAETLDDSQEWSERFGILLAQEGPTFVELRVEPLPQQTKQDFEMPEIPDLQFERMAREAAAMRALLASR